MPADTRPRSAREVWQELVDEAGEDEVERAASVSVEQAAGELAAMGFDVAAERARADALLDALARGEDVGEGEQEKEEEGAAERASKMRARLAPQPERKRRPGRVVFVAVAAAAVVGSAAAYAAMHRHEPRPSPSPSPSPGPEPSPTNTVEAPPVDIVAAAELRKRAAAAMDRGRWQECLSLLDQARAKDAAGDAAPEVTRLRDRASREREDRMK